jgi:DNA-binding CsgD family transcriptional regulator
VYVSWRIGLASNEATRSGWRALHDCDYARARQLVNEMPPSGERALLELQLSAFRPGGAEKHDFDKQEAVFRTVEPWMSEAERAIALSLLAISRMYDVSNEERWKAAARAAFANISSPLPDDARFELVTGVYQAGFYDDQIRSVCDEITRSDHDPHRRSRVMLTRHGYVETHIDPRVRIEELLKAYLLNQYSDEHARLIGIEIIRSMAHFADHVDTTLSNRIWELLADYSASDHEVIRFHLSAIWCWHAIVAALSDQSTVAYRLCRLVERTPDGLRPIGMTASLLRCTLAVRLGEDTIARGDMETFEPTLASTPAFQNPQLALPTLLIICQTLLHIDPASAAPWAARIDQALKQYPTAFGRVRHVTFQRVGHEVQALLAEAFRPANAMETIECAWEAVNNFIPWRASRIALAGFQVSEDERWLARAREQINRTPFPNMAANVAQAERERNSPIGKLTVRQLEVLRMLAKGAQATAIANELSLSTNTVRVHVQAIHRAFGVQSRSDLLSVLADLPSAGA